MEGKTYKYIEKSVEMFLYASAIQMMIATGVSDFFLYNIQVFLIEAFFICIGIFLYTLYLKKTPYYLKKGVWLFLFMIVLVIISTTKYAISIIEHQGITFFTVYQIVIFSIFGFSIYMFFSENRKCLSTTLFLICITESVLILSFQNRYMLDLGVYRFLGVYNNPNIQGLFAVICSMFALYLLSTDYGFCIISITNIAIYLSVIILTYSRTCIIAELIGMFVFGIFGITQISKKDWKKIGLIIVKTICLTALFYYIFLPSENDRLQSVVIGDGKPQEEQGLLNIEKVDGKDNTVNRKENTTENISNQEINKEISRRFSLSTNNNNSILHNLRFQIWEEYLLNASNYYLFGTDYTLNARPMIDGQLRDPHNTIIYTFFRYGILGACSLLILLVVIGIKLLMKKNKKGYQIAILSCFCATCVISLFNDLLNTPIYFFVLGISYVIMDENREDEDFFQRQPKRVLQVFSTLNRGGAESRTMDIYRRIQKEKVQFDFAVTTEGVERQFFYHEINKMGGKIYEIKSWKNIGIIKYFKQWKSILKENNYKIVHAHVGLESGVILYFSWLNGVEKRIAHARDSGVYDVSRVRRYYLRITRMMTNIFSTDKIYCSPEAATHVFGEKVCNRRNSYFLPNAIDLDLYKQTSDDLILAKKAELNLEKYNYIIGTVGNGRTVKNHIFLVKAFHEFLKLKPKSILLVIGNNVNDIEAKQYIREQGIENSVWFMGVRTDIAELLHVLDVFVLPSLTEGAPGSVIEAQAANIPCILSDTITHSVDVKSGLLKYISLKAPLDEWARQILYCCQMKRPDRDITMKKLIDYGYDIEHSVKMLMDIYEI